MNELDELRRRIAELEQSEANRKRAWEALQASEVWYRALAENLPGIVYRVYIRESNRMQFFNNMLPTMTGYKVEEIEGSQVCSLESLIVPEDRVDIMATVKNAIMEDKPFEVEYRLKHKDGDIRYFFERGRPIRGTDGKPLHIDGVILDITERKRAEEALQESQKRYREIWDDAPVAYHMLDARGIIKQVNQTEIDMLGYTRDEMVGKPIFEFILPEQRKEAEERFRLKLAGKNVPKKHDRLYVKKDGSKMYVSIDDVLEYDSDGKLLGVRTTMVDVSQEKRAEEALRKAHDELEKRVEERTSGLVKANEQLKREIADRKRAEEAQRESEKRLYREQKRMEMLKFANDLALKLMHELRNPLVVVGGFAARISNGDYPKDKLKEYTGLIFEESKRLDNVLEEVVAHLKTASEQV